MAILTTFLVIHWHKMRISQLQVWQTKPKQIFLEPVAFYYSDVFHIN